jgi:hypothetical protein
MKVPINTCLDIFRFLGIFSFPFFGLFNFCSFIYQFIIFYVFPLLLSTFCFHHFRSLVLFTSPLSVFSLIFLPSLHLSSLHPFIFFFLVSFFLQYEMLCETQWLWRSNFISQIEVTSLYFNVMRMNKMFPLSDLDQV